MAKVAVLFCVWEASEFTTRAIRWNENTWPKMVRRAWQMNDVARHAAGWTRNNCSCCYNRNKIQFTAKIGVLFNSIVKKFTCLIYTIHLLTATGLTASGSSTVQYSTVQHSTAQHSTAQNSTVQHSTAQYSTVQNSTAQYSTAQHSTLQ
jgi:hypothetical protein